MYVSRIVINKWYSAFQWAINQGSASQARCEKEPSAESERRRVNLQCVLRLIGIRVMKRRPLYIERLRPGPNFLSTTCSPCSRIININWWHIIMSLMLPESPRSTEVNIISSVIKIKVRETNYVSVKRCTPYCFTMQVVDFHFDRLISRYTYDVIYYTWCRCRTLSFSYQSNLQTTELSLNV